MIDMEVIALTTNDRPSDEGVPKSQFKNRPAGETLRNLLAGLGIDKSVYSVAPIGEEDVDFEGAAVMLDDVVTRSSRLFVRPRVDGADSSVVFMYAADGDDFVPFGAVDLNEAQAALGETGADCYDCVMTLAKERCDAPMNGKPERPKAAALHLLNSKPSRNDLEFFALSEYSPTLLGPTMFDESLKSSRRYWVRVDAYAKFLEVIEPLRGRRVCHVIFVRRARSAGERAAKPAPPRGASEELPAKPKGKKGSFIYFADEKRAALAKKGMSAREIARPRRHRIEAYCSRAEPPVSPQARSCSDLWSELTPEAKQKYQALADEDEVRYEKEMDLWRAQCAKVAGDSRAAKPPPLSIEIVGNAIEAVMESDPSIRAALFDGILTAKMLLTAVATHLEETDGGARLKREFESDFTEAVMTANAYVAHHLAHKAPPEPDEPAAEPPPAPELLTGAAGLLQILDEFRIKNGGVDDPYYAAMRSALEELEIEERKEGN